MKLNQLYESILEEGITPVVYHTTSYASALRILSTDRFAMSTAHDTDKEFEISKKLFFMSTARSKLNPFNNPASRSGNVTFTLNGRLLGNNLGGMGVDFFGKDGYDRVSMRRTYEFEDRVFSSKPTIERFSQFITEVSIHIRPVTYTDWLDDFNTEELKMARLIEKICLNKGIKFGLYDNAANFSKSRNPIYLPSIDGDVNANQFPYSTRPKNQTDARNSYIYENDIDTIHSLVYLIRKSKDKQFRGRFNPTSLRNLQKNIRTNTGETLNNIASLLTNKDFITIPAVREQMAFLVQDMKRSGMTSDMYLIKLMRQIREEI